jgi:prepilin-type N-terminal cleavage/methylation domain-containing protein/prepilin-type processing-associated H-X9-DG protein
MKQRAFTLIELLVVVAIIALLISILLPALGRARDLTKAAVCASRLHQLGLALNMYAQTNNNWLPEWGYSHGGGEAGAAHAWINTMGKDYGDNKNVLRCPKDESPYWSRPLNGKLRRTSYATNYYLVVGGEDNPLWTPEKPQAYNRLDWIKHPTSTLFFVELAEAGDYALSDHVHSESWVDFYPDQRQKATEAVNLDRHLGQANYGLVDGHAERLPFEKTYDIQQIRDDGVDWRYNKYDPTIAR